MTKIEMIERIAVEMASLKNQIDKTYAIMMDYDANEEMEKAEMVEDRHKKLIERYLGQEVLAINVLKLNQKKLHNEILRVHDVIKNNKNFPFI